MNKHLDKIGKSFVKAAPERGWTRIKLFYDVIETGGFCSRLLSLIDPPEASSETIFPKDEFDENGDLVEWNYMDDLEVIWESQADTDKKWYCAEITIYPDGSVDFQPTCYEEPKTLQIEHSLK